MLVQFPAFITHKLQKLVFQTHVFSILFNLIDGIMVKVPAVWHRGDQVRGVQVASYIPKIETMVFTAVVPGTGIIGLDV